MPDDAVLAEPKKATVALSDTAASLPAVARPKAELVAGAPIVPIIPRTIDETFRIAQAVLIAGAIPDALAIERGVNLPEKEVVSRVVTIIMAGAEVGMGPMASLANIALINKRRSIWGQAAVALIQSKGVLEEMKIERIGTQPGADASTAQFPPDFGLRVTMKRRGQAQPYIGEYTVGRAKRAHLWMNPKKAPWCEHPERQLQWRAFHLAATDGFADCLMGLMIREVAEDLSAPPAMTDTSFLADNPPPAEAPAETGGPSGAATPQADQIAAPSSSPAESSAPPSDWPQWMAGVLEEVEAAASKADLDLLKDRHAEPMAKAPAPVVGQITARIRDKHKRLAK